MIAQQLLSIRQALLRGARRFDFSGSSAPRAGNEGIRLRAACGVFITMNPGYAGRTELPDNLKALFRPCAMMVPDYALIAEIVLYAEGFLDARSLAKKMVRMYKLCSEQLSLQDHYDYGMRQLKSVLEMAGRTRRAAPKLHESAALIRAMREASVPRFVPADLPLFDGILCDLFPTVQTPDADYTLLANAASYAYRVGGLQPESSAVAKVVELYMTLNVRFGVMLVGPAASGKSSTRLALLGALRTLAKESSAVDSGAPATEAASSSAEKHEAVSCESVYPKTMTMGELYGEYNQLTQEWRDGIASSLIRDAVTANQQPTTPVTTPATIPPTALSSAAIPTAALDTTAVAATIPAAAHTAATVSPTAHAAAAFSSTARVATSAALAATSAARVRKRMRLRHHVCRLALLLQVPGARAPRLRVLRLLL